jgi:predicted phage terminase large subunit-like protein
MTPEDLIRYRETLLIERDRRTLPKSFLAFVRAAWHTIEDDPIYGDREPDGFDGGFVGLICEYLEALQKRETLNEVVNLPPRSGKSNICSVLWPIWCWLNDPKEEILVVSYSDRLCLKLGQLTLRVIQHPWFQARFGDLVSVKGNAAPTLFETDQGGKRSATTPHGQGITGFHPSIKIVDDPIKPDDAKPGKKIVENVTQWFVDVLRSRGDPRSVVTLLVMQRLSEVDPAQYALDSGWTPLILPVKYEPNRFPELQQLKSGRVLMTDSRTKDGDLLAPWFTEDFLAGFTPYVYAAQYLQRPSPEGQRIFQPEYLERTWEKEPTNGVWCISCDAAFKAEATSDYVVIQVWCRVGHEYYLVDQYRERMTFTDTCAAIERLAAKYPRARAKLIEDKANGSAIVDTLGRKLSGVLAVNPEGGKEARANGVQPLFAAKNVVLPARAPWLEDYRRELLYFPHGKHDDQVDSSTMALLWLSERGAGITAPDDDMVAALLGGYRPAAAEQEAPVSSGYQAWRMRRAG